MFLQINKVGKIWIF